MKIWLVTMEGGQYPDETHYQAFDTAFYSEEEAQAWIKAQKKRPYDFYDAMPIELDWDELGKQLPEATV